MAQLEEWCLDKQSSPEQLDQAARDLREAGYKIEMSRIVHHALADPDANPHVGALWIRRVVSRRRWNGRYPDHLDSLCRQGEIGRRAVIEFLETMSERRKQHLVRRVLRKHGAWLRKHPLGWAAAARALVRLGAYGKLRRWLSDRQDRADLDLETTYALASALRATGREAQAAPVVHRALDQPHAVEQYPALRLWSALEDALAGRTQPAAEQFEPLNPSGWDEYTTCLYYLTRGVIRVQQAGPDDRDDVFEREYRRIQERFRITRVHHCGALVRREYRRCVCQMGRDAGRFGPRVMANWRSADSVWFALPLLFVPGLQLFLPVYLVRLCSGPRRVAT